MHKAATISVVPSPSPRQKRRNPLDGGLRFRPDETVHGENEGRELAPPLDTSRAVLAFFLIFVGNKDRFWFSVAVRGILCVRDPDVKDSRRSASPEPVAGDIAAGFWGDLSVTAGLWPVLT